MALQVGQSPPVATPGEATSKVATSPSDQTSGLLSQMATFINQGFANGWQSFGTSSAWDPKELGQDIGIPFGTPILGMNNATVTAVNPTWAGASGGLVEITDLTGNIFRVGHVTPSVKVGQQVTASDIIGYSSGAAGSLSSGPHIEFQVQPLGSGTTVDPLSWLKGLTIVTDPTTTIIKTPLPTQTTTTPTTTQTTAQVGTSPTKTNGPSGTGFADILVALVLILVAIALFVIGFRLLVGNKMNIELPEGVSLPPEVLVA